MLHSWTMLFLTVPLAAGREGDSCGPQGSCLLCHGPTARVGEACYHTEEIGVDCDKTTHGHPCCVISEECECVQERFHTQIFPPSLPPRECMLRGRSFFPDDNTKPALVDWRPFIFVTILVIVLVVTCVIINVWRRRRAAKNTLKIDNGDEVEEEEEDHRSQDELDV